MTETSKEADLENATEPESSQQEDADVENDLDVESAKQKDDDAENKKDVESSKQENDHVEKEKDVESAKQEDDDVEKDVESSKQKEDDAVGKNSLESSPQNTSFQTAPLSDDGTCVAENKTIFSDKQKKYLKILMVYGWCAIIGVAIFVTFFLLKKDKFEEFAELGYPYTKDLTFGWIFDANIDTAPKSFSYYNSTDLVPNGGATEVDCARQCSRENAFAGTWNAYYSECWCYFDLPGNNFCFEGCVIESGFEFSSRSFEDFDYCKKSYCEVFEADEYCKFKEYNPDLCIDP